jgi:choline dehydrogenase-like flavoprotein
MQRGGAALGLKTSPAPNAALSSTYYQEGVGYRPACSNRGFCQAGCSTGAKGAVDVTFIPLALKAGAEIREQSFVTGFERDGAGRMTAVLYQDAKGEQRQRCRHVFLCAGAVESPRLLLLNDLANSSDQVGRNFMAHPGVQVWGVFDELIKPTRGVPGGLISEDTHRPKGADFAGGYLIQSIGVMPVTYVGQLARSEKLWGQALVDHMQGFNHVAGINILGDCLPHADNRLTLSDEVDVRGLPKPLVTFSNGDNEKRMGAHAERLLRDIWTAAGAHELHVVQRNAHTIGTCRMGVDGDDAVVNADCRSFDIDNLYICDNSVYPSALSVNPALTQMALSLRTADRFLSHGRF